MKCNYLVIDKKIKNKYNNTNRDVVVHRIAQADCLTNLNKRIVY